MTHLCIDEGYALVYPHYKSISLAAGMKEKIIAALARRYKCTLPTVSKFFDPTRVEAYGRLRQKFSEAGETMVASEVVKMTSPDARDASYVRVSDSVLCSATV